MTENQSSSAGSAGRPPHIFCIGLNKTGTGSLHLAFGVLGISSAHYFVPEGNTKDIIAANSDAGRPLMTGLEHYRAVSDWNRPETNALFVTMDEQYPGSKFILTTRDLDGWLRSRDSHVLANREKPDYQGGWLTIDHDAWIEEYNTHHRQVRAYFADRPEDLLELDISRGGAWDVLCPFLGVPIPDAPFPHKNKAPRLAQRLKRKTVAGWRAITG